MINQALLDALVSESMKDKSWDDEQSYFLEWVKKDAALQQGGLKILTVGCSGDIFSELLNASGHEVTGVDQRPYSLSQWGDFGREWPIARPAPFKFIQSDFDDVFFPDSYFDMAIALSSIEHFGLGRWKDKLNPDGDLEACKKVLLFLRPRGRFWLSVPNAPAAPGAERYNRDSSQRGYTDIGIDLLLKGFTITVHEHVAAYHFVQAVKP